MKTEKMLEQACEAISEVLHECREDVEEAFMVLNSGERLILKLSVEIASNGAYQEPGEGRVTLAFAKEKVKVQRSFGLSQGELFVSKKDVQEEGMNALG